MHFLLHLSRDKNFDLESGNPALNFIDTIPGKNFYRFDYGNYDGTILFVMGDMIIPGNCCPVPDKESSLREYLRDFNPGKLREMKGFFYIIIVESNRRIIKIFSSLFNILPVYYFKAKDGDYVSSAVEHIRQASGFSFNINKKLLLEKLLFNYALFNETIIKEIRLLPTNCYLELGELGKPGNNLEIKKHTNISDYFVFAPVPWKKSIGDISNLYLDIIRYYLPAEHFYMTLTGGFDSRTNVAAALKYQKDFTTFSYGGGVDTPDIMIPTGISKTFNIPYKSFLLDETYAQDEFIPHALGLVTQTDAAAGISRAHYLYTARQLSPKCNYLVTGNFGSELLRCMHVMGVMVSPLLYQIFSGTNPKELTRNINNDTNLRFLRIENFKDELNELNEEIIRYRENFHPLFNLNQDFYIYIFEEVFRKYFGPEIIIQANCHLYSRSPYLDFDFIRALLKTELAGINSGFWESNPLVRFRGQVLYAHIIQKAFPGLNLFPTERLYKPADFFSLTGKMNIAHSFFTRKYFKKQPLTAPAYNRVCYQTNMAYFKRLAIDTELFAHEEVARLMDTGWPDAQDLFSHLMSLLIYTSRR